MTAEEARLLIAIGVAAVAFVTLIFKGGKWVGGVEKSLESHGTLLAEIRDDIKKVFRRLSSSTVTGESPLRLTGLGKMIADAINADGWVKETAPILFERAKGKRPDEVQDLCFDFVNYEYEPDSELDVAIKVAAYENGIDTRQVYDVLAIVLRDRLLILIGLSESNDSSESV